MKPVEEIARELDFHIANALDGICCVHTGELAAVATALRAERERAERAEEQLKYGRWEISEDGDDLLICRGHHAKHEACEFERYVPVASAEKAEAERDEAGDKAADFIFSQLATALNVPEWTPEDGSEMWEGDVSATLYSLLRKARVLDPETDELATTALATARNRALEEAAECAGEDLTAYDEEGNDGEVWVVRKIVDAILALRTKEPE